MTHSHSNENRMTYYELMINLTNFTLGEEFKLSEKENIKELSVHCNKILDKEFIFFKNKEGKNVLTICLTDAQLRMG